MFISNNNFVLAILNNRQQECAARQPPPLDETEPSTSGHPSAAEKDILVRNCLQSKRLLIFLIFLRQQFYVWYVLRWGHTCFCHHPCPSSCWSYSVSFDFRVCLCGIHLFFLPQLQLCESWFTFRDLWWACFHHSWLKILGYWGWNTARICRGIMPLT